MKAFSVTWYEKLRKLDYIVLAAVLGLTLMSLLTLAGARRAHGSGKPARRVAESCRYSRLQDNDTNLP